MKPLGLSKEAVERMTEREIRDHVDALAGLEMAERELIGDQLDQEEAQERERLARKARRYALLGRTRGRR